MKSPTLEPLSNSVSLHERGWGEILKISFFEESTGLVITGNEAKVNKAKPWCSKGWRICGEDRKKDNQLKKE